MDVDAKKKKRVNQTVDEHYREVFAARASCHTGYLNETNTWINEARDKCRALNILIVNEDVCYPSITYPLSFTNVTSDSLIVLQSMHLRETWLLHSRWSLQRGPMAICPQEHV